MRKTRRRQKLSNKPKLSSVVVRSLGVYLILCGVLLAWSTQRKQSFQRDGGAIPTGTLSRELGVARDGAEQAGSALGRDEICDACIHVMRTQNVLNNLTSDLEARAGRAEKSGTTD